MQIFGYQFVRVKDNPDKEFSSFTPKATDDGAVTIAASAFSSQYVDLEGTVRTEAELITRYRKMALNPEIIKAVDEITNEAVTRDDDGEVVKIFLDNVDISPNLKKLIEAEFENVKSLLRFNVRYFEIFKRWYIDGRLYYHAIIDEKNLEQGIQELRYVDPRKIKKVREVVRKKSHQSPDSLFSTKNEYYIYNDRGFNPVGIAASTPTASGIRIAKDSIVFVTSGLVDTNQTMVLSYLHQAIKALNELRTLEDATVIYRITRAPERRVWYIDIGQLPNHKAEQYVRDVMANHKNRMIYDSMTGEIKDDRRFMTMLEDYWLPRREGGRGTEVTTLKGGESLGKMEDVEYFQKKLFNSLNIPVARLEPENSIVSIGGSGTLSREELKFSKFVDRLGQRFATLFTEVLEKQLVLKKIFSIEEFLVFKDMIEYEFSKDNYFTELKAQEVLTARMNALMALQPFIGMYYSNEWVRKEILKQDDKQIRDMDKQIEEEQENYQYLPPDQKMMLQQQEQQDQQMAGEQDQQAQQAASPMGQAQQTSAAVKQNPNPSLQDMSKGKRANKMLGSGTN